MSKPKILIIEDDRPLSDVLAYNLDREGYEVWLARDGEDGLRQAQVKLPDVILLDIMLPLMDGLEICRRLRSDSATQHIPVIMLTARSEETDQLVGFSMGADDYVTKPFSTKVLLQRIKAITRRQAEGLNDNDLISHLGVTLDRRRHRTTAGNELLSLTRSEFRLLETLIRQPGRAFSRHDLIDAALGEDTMVTERTIDVHIRALRKKLDRYAELIETVRGIGYRFREE